MKKNYSRRKKMLKLIEKKKESSILKVKSTSWKLVIVSMFGSSLVCKGEQTLVSVRYQFCFILEDEYWRCHCRHKLLTLDPQHLCQCDEILFFPRQSSSDLACFIRFEKVNVYTASNYREKFKAPTSFCFVLKVSHSVWDVSCLGRCTLFFFFFF